MQLIDILEDLENEVSTGEYINSIGGVHVCFHPMHSHASKKAHRILLHTHDTILNT